MNVTFCDECGCVIQRPDKESLHVHSWLVTAFVKRSDEQFVMCKKCGTKLQNRWMTVRSQNMDKLVEAVR